MPRALALAAVLVWLGAARAADPGSGPLVRYQDDRLSVRLVDVPAETVLQELANATGAEIRGQPAPDKRIRAQFEEVPLPEALERLLGRNSFALVYAEDGTLRAIRLLASATGPPPVVMAPRPAPNAALAALLTAQPPAELNPRLAGMLGVSHMKLDDLVRTALIQGGATRNEASRVLNDVFYASAELQAAATSASEGAERDSLEDLMHRLVGSRAEEVLRDATTDAKRRDLRLRGMALIRRMRTPTTPPPTPPQPLP